MAPTSGLAGIITICPWLGSIPGWDDPTDRQGGASFRGSEVNIGVWKNENDGVKKMSSVELMNGLARARRGSNFADQSTEFILGPRSVDIQYDQ